MRRFLALILLYGYVVTYGQQSITISLDETIQIAQGEAPIALIARTRFTNNYWQYQSFLADFRPQLSLNSTIPDLNRGIDLITLPDGSDAFVERSLMTSSVGLQLGQIIPQTGGFVYAGTNLRRIDLFKNDLNPKRLSYLSVPLSVGFSQPLFQHNAFKWDKEIEALQYEESKQLYAEENEQIAFDAVNLYFSLYIAQLNLEEAERQKVYTDSLYETSKGRFGVGKIAETDLLQIELRARNAETNLATELLNYQTSNEELRNYLGFRESVNFTLRDPEILPDYVIDLDTALDHARRNRSQTTEFRRR
ncbi:MAG: TolC family protein, partial [Saprospiraceae bacterium]|nr:TolC family protein [Saprospiraceae bacterium]